MEGRNRVAELEAQLDHAKDTALRYKHTSGIYEKELELKAAEIEELKKTTLELHQVARDFSDEIGRLRSALKEMSREDMTNHARDILNAALEGKDE